MEILTIRPLGKRNQFRESWAFIIRLGCIFLFLSSAYGKVVEHDKFIRGLSKVSFIGPLATLIALLVPLLEIAITILLIIPGTSKVGLNAFAGLMTVFTLYIGLMMMWADHLPCHCNLFIENFSWGQHLLFNLACIVLAIIALRLSHSKH